MSSKIRFNTFLLMSFLLNIFQLFVSNSNNEDVTKVVSCISLINQKYKGQSPEPKAYSALLLKCFITISDEEKKEILVGMQQNMEGIESEEIEKLTDVTTLKDIPQEQLKEHTIKLENAIKEFRKIQENYYEDKIDKNINYEEDEEFRKTHPSRGNSLGAFMKKTNGTLKLINYMGNIVIGIISIYFAYIMLGKFLGRKKFKKKIKYE